MRVNGDTSLCLEHEQAQGDSERHGRGTTVIVGTPGGTAGARPIRCPLGILRYAKRTADDYGIPHNIGLQVHLRDRDPRAASAGFLGGYADDILIYATSLSELERMTELLVIELRRAGLQLNYEKTKVLHSSSEDEDANFNFVDINGNLVRIIHSDSCHRYLGASSRSSGRGRCRCNVWLQTSSVI